METGKSLVGNRSLILLQRYDNKTELSHRIVRSVIALSCCRIAYGLLQGCATVHPYSSVNSICMLPRS